MTTSTNVAFFLGCVAFSLGTAGCGAATDDTETDAESVREDGLTEYSGETWKLGTTLHVGEHADDNLGVAGARIVHPIYLGADKAHPVTLRIAAKAAGSGSAQLALLAPLKNGVRATLATDGYSVKEATPAITKTVTEPGTYLLVVATFQRKTAGQIAVDTYATAGADRTDVLASPKAGALTGRRFSARLNPGLSDRAIELWASPPNNYDPAARKKIASVRTVNRVATFDVKTTQAIDGDDLSLVVPGLETGASLRLWTKPSAGVRLDRMWIGDLGNVIGFSGVLPFFEGGADVELRSVTRRAKDGKPLFLASTHVERTMPGQEGMGFAAFDANVGMEHFIPITSNNVNPLLPRQGEILTVGFGTEQPSFVPVACFEFCNDMMGNATCSLHAVTCPKL